AIIFFSLIISYNLLNISLSQTVINGKIYNKDNKVVPNTSVTLLKTADSTIVAYCIGNANGEYAIRYNGQEEELILCVYGFNVKREDKKIKNESQTVDFIVIEQAIELEEVVIKTDKMWGNNDTINYAVESFKDSTDIVIADVMKKMPGIDVKDSGAIEYRGKPISKFYIENMDMLQGRYGIATNNISAADVATVQVLENHQPIKALQDIDFSDGVAINLKLKDAAKGTYSMMADLGAGIDFDKNFLWNGGLTAMFFGKKRQHLLSYKTNNSGNDIYREFQSFIPDGISNIPQLSYMITPSPLQINKNRYFFNQGHGVTFNTLLKAKNEDEFTINLIGYHDIDNRNSQSVTTYFIPGEDTISIRENLASFSTINKLEGDLVYRRNQSKDYLTNTLKFAGAWENGDGNVLTDELIEQNFNQRSFKASNHFTWIARDDNKKGFEANSRTYFQRQPSQLSISPGVFTDILNDTLPYNSVRQNILFNSFETNNGMRFLSSIVWKSLRINPGLFLTLEHQSLNSHISKAFNNTGFIAITNDSLKNDVDWLRIKAGMYLNFDYSYKKFSATLNTPLGYRYTSLSGLNVNQPNQHKIIFQPSLSLRYIFTSRWQMRASWNYYSSNPNLSTLYSGYLLQDYRTLSRYENRLTNSRGNYANLRVEYKDVMSFFLADIELSYNNYSNEVMYAQEFEGSAMKISLIEMESKGDYFGVNGRVNKGFNWQKLSFNLAASWGRGNTPLLRQKELIRYINQGVNVNLTASLAITKRISFADKLSWSYITGTTDSDTKLDPMINFINAANMDFIILNNLILSASFEYYNIRNIESKHNFYMLDLSIMYKLKKVRLSLDWNNIFNTQNYIYSYYGNLNAYYSEYIIRPSSVMLRAQFKLF
ncbi:TonB-dependent receptor, partial [Bacteroidales bacterium OttesenSCG-928-L14]|nr:TonB-dependent receptor [Bacteroidales bacterium OttesenSCG-928-L14]